jgi:hypothetical protein
MRVRAGRRAAARAIALCAGVGAAAAAQAELYQLSALAGGGGESTLDPNVSSVSGLYTNPPEPGPGAGYESYRASANATGALSASCTTEGKPPFAPIDHRAAARIEETIHLPKAPYPNGPVTVTVSLVGGVGAGSVGGSVANASARLDLESNCYATDSTTSGPSGYCPGGTLGARTVTQTFSLQTLGNLGWEIDVTGQVEARCELTNANGKSQAQSVGTLYVQVSGGGVESYTWTGTSTNIPVPEPAAAPLGFAALAAIAALWRRLRAG